MNEPRDSRGNTRANWEADRGRPGVPVSDPFPAAALPPDTPTRETPEVGEFHQRDGWYFKRLPDGSVRIRKDGLQHIIPANEWESVIRETGLSAPTEKRETGVAPAPLPYAPDIEHLMDNPPVYSAEDMAEMVALAALSASEARRQELERENLLLAEMYAKEGHKAMVILEEDSALRTRIEQMQTVVDAVRKQLSEINIELDATSEWLEDDGFQRINSIRHNVCRAIAALPSPDSPNREDSKNG
jgi:hypothetical protein